MHSSSRPLARRSVAALAVLGAASLAGCSFSLDQDGNSSSGAPSTGSGTSDGDSSGSDAVVDEKTSQAGIDPNSLEEPIATAEVPAVVKGDENATLTVSLYSLIQNGKTLTATYSFRVNSPAGVTEDVWLWDYLGRDSWHPYLVDTVNLNRHNVLKGEGSQYAQTDYQGPRFAPGQTLYAYAVFAAPPEDVTTMNVMLVDSAPMATGVEIRR